MSLSDLFFAEASYEQTTHCLYPKGKIAKLLLPRKKMAAQVGLDFFLSFAQRNKLRIKNFFNCYKEPTCGTLAKIICETLTLTEAEVEHCTIAIGTPGPYQKHTILGIDQRLHPISISKIGTNEVTHNLLRNEAMMLQWLQQHKLLARYTPVLLGKNNKQNLFSITESIGEGVVAHRKKHRPAIYDFLHALHKESENQICFAESNIFQLLNKRFSQLKSILSKEWQDRADYFLQKFSQLDLREFRFVLAHRDFAEWNMRLGPSGIFVFDWEFAQFNYPPLYDVFHLHLMPIAVRGKLQENHLASMYKECNLFTQGDNGNELSFYQQLLLYLLDLSLFYLESNNGEDEGDIVVNQYANILDLLKNKMRNY